MRYYGLGNDEYDIYKTVDNGKTWNKIAPSIGETTTSGGRIIIYSQTDTGLKYTDDGFITIMDSNISEGNWKKVNPIGESILAESIEGKGIYESTDNGETWHFYMDGTSDNIGENGYQSDDKGSDLYFVLNKILIPQLSFILTGHNDINFFKNNRSLNFNSYFTDGDTFGVSNKSGIDFPADVGMKPLAVDDIQISNDIDSVINVEDTDAINEELLNSSSSLYKSFSILDSYIENYRKFFLGMEVKSAMKEKNDYTGLNDDQIESMSFFYDIYKGSIASIKGTIINSIFTFDNSKKLSLLKQSIINTADIYKGIINNNINSIKRDFYLSSENLKKSFSLNLKNMWNESLKYTIEDYYYKCKRNINYITDDNDKEYIFVAAKKYKEDRPVLLGACSKYVESINVTEEISFNKICENLKSLVRDTISKSKVIIDNYNAPATFNEGFPQEKNGAFRSRENPLSATIPEPRGQNIYADQLIALKEELLSRGRTIYESSPDFSLGILLSKYHSILEDMINENLRNDSPESYEFNSLEYNEYFDRFEVWEIDKSNNYHKEILMEFRKRVGQLFNIIGNNTIPVIQENMDVLYDIEYFMDNLIKKVENRESVEVDEHSLDFLISNIDESNELFLLLVKNGWNKLKENI